MSLACFTADATTRFSFVHTLLLPFLRLFAFHNRIIWGLDWGLLGTGDGKVWTGRDWYIFLFPSVDYATYTAYYTRKSFL